MNLKEIKEAGLLELYVYGCLNETERSTVLEALEKYPTLRQELEEIELALALYAEAHAIQTHATVKPFLLATIDYMDRLAKGVVVSSLPVLNEQSRIADYEQWFDREDLQAPEEREAIYAKIIAHEATKITAIVWLRFGAPPEVHNDEHEKFLIVEGSCTITAGDTEYHMNPGDYMEMPLHISHHVHVTSTVPCKVLLQRIASVAV